MKVKLYIEGGGNDRSLHIKCREGFRKLFEKAGFSGRMPSTKACGSRTDAYEDFVTALRNTTPDVYPILLVDSEDAVNQCPWGHLRNRDGWDQPADAEGDQAQLMVQCMETWCAADRDTLRRFFGHSLQDSALPDLNALENKNKDDVQNALVHATRNCGKDRQYKKGKRSFELLGELNPKVLEKCLPHFSRLCDKLREKL